MSGTRSVSLHGRPEEILPVGFGRCMVATALGVLSAAALVVVARRLAGALQTPLEPALLLTAGTLIAATAAAIRLGWRLTSSTSFTSWSDRVVMVFTSLAAVSLTAGLCLPGTPVVWIATLACLVALEELGMLGWLMHRRARRSREKTPRPIHVDAAHAAIPHAKCVNAALKPSALFDATEAPFPDEVTQQLTRSQAADGAEEFSGWLRMPFAAGQRTGNVHVAFCPPLSAVPELHVEQIDGPTARIKTAQVLPYGVRLDLKLAVTAEEPACVLLQFAARAARKT